MLDKKSNANASFILGISKAGGSQTCLVRVLWPIRFGKFCILYLNSVEIHQAHNAHQSIKSSEKSYSQEICWILFSLRFSKPTGSQTLFLPDTESLRTNFGIPDLTRTKDGKQPKLCGQGGCPWKLRDVCLETDTCCSGLKNMWLMETYVRLPLTGNSSNLKRVS